MAVRSALRTAAAGSVLDIQVAAGQAFGQAVGLRIAVAIGTAVEATSVADQQVCFGLEVAVCQDSLDSGDQSWVEVGLGLAGPAHRGLSGAQSCSAVLVGMKVGFGIGWGWECPVDFEAGQETAVKRGVGGCYGFGCSG